MERPSQWYLNAGILLAVLTFIYGVVPAEVLDLTGSQLGDTVLSGMLYVGAALLIAFYCLFHDVPKDQIAILDGKEVKGTLYRWQNPTLYTIEAQSYTFQHIVQLPDNTKATASFTIHYRYSPEGLAATPNIPNDKRLSIITTHITTKATQKLIELGTKAKVLTDFTPYFIDLYNRMPPLVTGLEQNGITVTHFTCSVSVEGKSELIPSKRAEEQVNDTLSRVKLISELDGELHSGTSERAVPPHPTACILPSP